MKIIDSNNLPRECEGVTVDKKYPGFVRVDFISKTRMGYKHSEWIPIDEFIYYNPSFKKSISNNSSKISEDLGVVSKAGPSFIKDASKSWLKDVFTGMPIWISRGKGEGERRKVVKNSKDTIYIDKPWKVIPDNTSQYVLSFNVDKNVKAVGNTLPGVENKKFVENLIKKAKKTS